FAGGGVALGGVFGKAFQRDGLELNVDALLMLPRRGGLFKRDFAEDSGSFGGVDGGGEREQLVEGSTEGIDVGSVIDEAVLGEGLLRGHVAKRAENVAGAGP